MRVVVIGAGYVGLATSVGLCLRGHAVTVVERDRQRRDALQDHTLTLSEPGISDAMREVGPQLRTVAHLSDVHPNPQIVFLAVGTPSDAEGHVDLTDLRQAVRTASAQCYGALVVIRSTVPPGTTGDFANEFPELRFAHVPEFLREGHALADFLNPVRIVLGVSDGDSAALLRRLLDPHRPATVQLAAARALATIGREVDWEALRPWSVRADQIAPLFPDARYCVPCEGDQPPGTAPLVWVLETVYADKAARWWSSKGGRWLSSEEKKPRMDADRGADKIVAAAHRHTLERGELSAEDFQHTVLHLGSLARDRDFELLVDLLDRQDNRDRQSSVIQALGHHGDPRVIPMFVQWLAEVPDSQPDLAADLLRAAGRLGWPQLSPDILSLWKRYPAPQVRLNLLSALGDSGGPEAVRFLLDRVRLPTQELSDLELEWTARSLRRCGVIGREAIRGAVAMARAGDGERDRVTKLAALAGVH